jgi:hypothetical protein
MALEAERRPEDERRVFSMIVENHMKADAEIARFRTDNSVTHADIVIARVIVPHERRSGETAQEAYERELRVGYSEGDDLMAATRYGVLMLRDARDLNPPRLQLSLYNRPRLLGENAWMAG